MLVNARHVKNLPGARPMSRTRPGWRNFAHGLVSGSFVPPEPIRGLRDLTRTASRHRLRARDLSAPWLFMGDRGEVITDRAPALANEIEDLTPGAWHNTGQYRIQCDHGRLRARLRPVGGLKTRGTASGVIRGHALIQNICRATTSLQSMPHRCSGWLPHSTNSDLRCDHHGHRLRNGTACQRTTQKCTWTSFIAVLTSGRGSAARGHRGGRSTRRRGPSRRAEPPARDCVSDPPGR